MGKTRSKKGNNNKNKNKKNRGIHKFIIFMLVIVVLAGISIAIAVVFKANTIEYVGCEHYSDEELTSNIFKKKGANTLIYYLYEKNNPVEMPFIQKYDVEIIWPNKMYITVYEKPVVGFVSYMGCNMYFDKDGTVVESSTEKLDKVPQVTGLDFKSIVLNSKLQVGDQTVFSKILELTQSFDKYEIKVDKIYFDNVNEVTLYMENVKVLLGECDDIVDKLYELKQISASLTGLKGTLHLENYTEDSNSVIFKQEK